jgi:long-chain fatty acid transport protein
MHKLRWRTLNDPSGDIKVSGRNRAASRKHQPSRARAASTATGQSTRLLFEEGTYVELGYTFVTPNVSGVQVLPLPGSPAGSPSGDVAPDYSSLNLGFRTDITDELSFALIIDEPIGASVDYSAIAPGTGYLYRFGTGSTADLSSTQTTLAARYEMPSAFPSMAACA